MGNTSVQSGLSFTFRLFPLIRPGLRPVHLPRWGRLPPAGKASVPHLSGPLALPPSRKESFFPLTRPGYALPPSLRRGLFFPKILYFHQKQKNCFDKRMERTYNKYNGTEWG